MHAYQVTVLYTTKIPKGHPMADRFPGDRDVLDGRSGWRRGRLIVLAHSPHHARELTEHEHRDLAKEYPFKVSTVEPVTVAAVYRVSEPATPGVRAGVTMS